ncbi:transposase [Hymenobacter sp. H14-R3]|uniref:transposase n=1 Tax=Hymenobacter sp. H14-R3 TaxID=3046308 RepID=UPI0024BB2AF6|nr:transposase [Hymenobacter sp. H14-R3]MDJ0364562.1 transposase [Hymenobacter sp. H14-R3]
MEVLRKDIIRTWILPYLSIGTHRPACQADLLGVVKLILYKLKTGCQWRQLPLKQFFNENFLSWESMYYRFNE